MESFYKVYMLSQNGQQVSCVEPVLYGTRFRKFMEEHVIINEERMRNFKDIGFTGYRDI